jgi:NAD(P)H-dependent FMN reductase
MGGDRGDRIRLECAVIYGSVRSNRKGIKAARFVTRVLKERGHGVTLVDAADYPLPFLDRMYKEYDAGAAPEPMEKIADVLRAADAFVVVSGEYNHGMPAALKNLLDHYQTEYFWKPAGIVTYSGGPFGGVRVAVHLRAVLGELGMVTLPSMFAVSKVGSSFDDDGNPTDDTYVRRVQKFLDELEWYGTALKAARASGVPY